MEHLIKSVEKDSIAQELDIKRGDTLLSINNQSVRDILDYQRIIAEENLLLLMKKESGDLLEFDIEKGPGEDLGIVFYQATLDKIKTCQNKCLFCFIDQLPSKMRKSLYLKDDDYRLSLMWGSYITLTNLDTKDFNRIKSDKISPLYISIHTTNPELRKKLLGNKKADNILNLLKDLSDAGIYFHGQIVLCPQFNDGEELDATLEDLIKLCPNLLSLALVPVGITKHREKLYNLKKYSRDQSQRLINQCENWQIKFKEKVGQNVVYAADEFYISAGRKVPNTDEYEGFPQLENGVGLIRVLLEEYKIERQRLPKKMSSQYSFSVACGISAEKVFKPIVRELNKIEKLNVKLYAINNNYFGRDVTVTGLITGSDLIENLSRKNLGEDLIVSDIMLKDGKNIFLDDLTPNDVEKALEVKIKPLRGIKELIDLIIYKNIEEDGRL